MHFMQPNATGVGQSKKYFRKSSAHSKYHIVNDYLARQMAK